MDGCQSFRITRRAWFANPVCKLPGWFGAWTLKDKRTVLDWFPPAFVIVTPIGDIKPELVQPASPISATGGGTIGVLETVLAVGEKARPLAPTKVKGLVPRRFRDFEVEVTILTLCDSVLQPSIGH